MESILPSSSFDVDSWRAGVGGVELVAFRLTDSSLVRGLLAVIAYYPQAVNGVYDYVLLLIYL